MAVLIIAPEADDHAVTVKARLEALGSEVEVLDTGLFPEVARLAMHYSCCRDERRLRIEMQGRTLDLARFGAVWWRRPRPPGLSGQMVRPSHRQFAANEAAEALAGLWQTMAANWVNAPAADLCAQHKAYQLRVAQSVGLRIPATLVTNDPHEARRFVDAKGFRGVVYKSFSSTEEEWRETRVLKAEEIDLLDHVQHAPVIFQHYVEARHDLRITVVGESMFTAAIHSQQTAYPVDSRIDIGTARIEPVDLPEAVRAKLAALMRKLDLTYGAIDVRVTPEGEQVFLEVNPAGQFTYIEAATGLPIADALAAELQRVDAPAGAATASAAWRAAESSTAATSSAAATSQADLHTVAAACC